MIPENRANPATDDSHSRRWLSSRVRTGSLRPHPATVRANRFARFTARQARKAPGVPGAWSRFLIAYARWILVCTVAAVGAAAALAHSQTRLYQSEAVVEVGFPAAQAGALQAPDMATEKGVASSGVVLATAARLLSVPQADLQNGLSVTVPASTYLMQIYYSDPNPYVAQERAEALARAYVSYRTPKSAAAKKTAKTVSALPAAAASAPTAELITPATLPAGPSSPNYVIDIVAALIVGLALGIGTAAIRDHLDDRVRGAADVETQAGAPVLALIPAFRSARGDPASRLVMLRNPDSVVAEAYRGLRTRVLQAAASHNAKTLLVTSPAWEDKATVAANLAIGLAQAGRSVVVVCADLRWGEIPEMFGLATRGGLTWVLERPASPVPALRPSGVPGLRLLPVGLLPPDPAAVLQRPAWRTVIADLRRQADVVIIDAPPLLVSPDAGPIAEFAEMILLVTGGRQSGRAQVRAAARELAPFRDRVAGCVLNDVGRRRWLRASREPTPAANGHAPDARARLSVRAHGRVPAGQGGDRRFSRASGPDAR